MKKIKILIILIIIPILLYLGIYFYAWTNPKLTLNNSSSFYFYDNDSNLIDGSDDWISYENLSQNLINATIATEDKNFFNHQGFDYLRIGKALLNNIQYGTTQGASTITQQYAKNLYLDFDQTLKRKINEAWLTVRLEVHYSKEEIFEGYVNTINYGGVFGIENASKYYFDKSASDLSVAEAAMLAGIPNYPSKYSPFIDLEAALERQEIVLYSMLRDGYITDIELNDALEEPLVFSEANNTEYLNSIMYYKDVVINELQNITSIPSSFLETGGLKIYTNLDIEYQKAIEDTIKENIDEEHEIQNAIVIMDPNTGKVLALSGGKNYNNSQYNRAIYDGRAVGSTLKPFLYYSALENGFTASTNFTSEKTNFVFNNDEVYSPTNYNDLYANQSISLASALAYSDNIFAVKTHLFLGEENLVNIMKRVGVNTSLNSVPSLALGSQEISLLEMTQAYSTLANEGEKTEPYFISRIEDIEGNILYEHKIESEAVLNKSTTFIISELLANANNPNFINYLTPTFYGIEPILTNKYAIKTGTTDFDHLVFGYNENIVVGSWSGYDDNRELIYGDVTLNKEIWASLVLKLNIEDNWYDIPSNVVGVLSDPLTGALANENTKNSTILYYIKGTEPTKSNNLDDLIPTIKLD